MPITKHHCSKCDHGFGDADTAARCEAGHVSVVNFKARGKLKKGGGSISTITEKYADLKEFPSEIILTLNTGRVIRYITEV